ncbi:hypothetical protein F0919_07900 [Taibaiella lutea]|uniref:Uncharacterized protein n=1 Tax=Taibaiella lutea TaxID=2608001 RepID=A0A5M6CMK3_9BACT|nr:hypothetical protein [Taibaiella lutea]KAA5534535.1 hypothetical protein F0919_07900 [Taibaiella lutea]
MNSDSHNSLVQFDLCMCLSEDAINTQLETAWASWKARKKWDNKISLFLTKVDKKTGVQTPSREGIKSTIAPLKISLNVPNGKFGQVLVTLTLDEGTVFYRGDDGIEEETIEDWNFSFIADLDKKPVDMEALKKIDPSAFQEANELIDSAKESKKDLSDSVFSIEYLFMKFTNVDTMLIDNRSSSIPKNANEDAVIVAKRAIGNLLKGEMNDQFILGTVVRRTSRKSTPTFALTDFIFHVHTHPAVSTLDYLGMLSDNPLPNDINAARSLITSPWIQPELMNGETQLLNGAMIISKKSYFDFYLIPYILKVLGADNISYENLRYKFSDSKRNTGKQDLGLYFASYDNENKWEVNMEIVPGTNRIKIEGFIDTKLYLDLTTLSQDIGHLHLKGHNSLSGSITIKGDTPVNGQRQPEPEKFNIQLDADINFKGVEMKEDNVSGLIEFSQAFESVLKTLNIIGETSVERIRKGQADMVKLISDTLEAKLNNLKIEMNNHAFIPPGGGVFSYQNPHFSSTGNLYIDAIYHSA